MLKYNYKETAGIRKLLNEIEALKIVFDTFKPLSHIEENIRRKSVLKSSVYSARIEGNPLRIEEAKIDAVSGFSKNTQKLEIFNLQRAHTFIYSNRSPKKVGLDLIKKLHGLVMKNISGSAGKFRSEPWGIFNSAGVAVYLAPAHFNIPELMAEYVEYLKSIKAAVPVKAAMSQFIFEKIHPFADGNGRVGRLISSFIMQKGGWGFRGLVSVEETIDKNKERYYETLEPSSNTNPFIEFFLESFISQTKEVFEELSVNEKEIPEDRLLPRRREMLEIIKNHPYCSFDFISRRFLAVNPKTLHYDLKKLQDGEFIIKVGKTRGATYKAEN